MANGLKSQGTELFFLDTVSASQEVLVRLVCPEGITGLGGAADQIEDTCLDNLTDKTYVRGLGNPGQVTVPYIFNPQQASHQLLADLLAAGETIEWCIAFSDGTSDPTINSDETISAPPNRTSAIFQAYIADLNFDIAKNDIVRGTMLLQRSGSVAWDYA